MASLIILIPTIDPAFDEAGNVIPGSFTGLILFLLALNVLLNLPVDILSSYAAFRIGRGLGLRSAWLAWIPGGSLWVMGCIADDYQKLVKGRKSYLRWILPLNVVWAVFLCVITMAEGASAETICALADRFLLIPVLLSIGGIVAAYIALYRVYRYSVKEYAVVFTVLGVVYGVPTPFFLLRAAKEW
jgi:hypothetical protein